MSTSMPDKGYLGPAPSEPTYDVMVIGDRAYRIHNVTVHRFRLGDVEDPEIYAGQPLWEWQNSEVGQWIMKRAIETPVWHKRNNYDTWGWDVIITAKLKEQDYTFWTLKWGSQVPT